MSDNFLAWMYEKLGFTRPVAIQNAEAEREREREEGEREREREEREFLLQLAKINPEVANNYLNLKGDGYYRLICWILGFNEYLTSFDI